MSGAASRRRLAQACAGVIAVASALVVPNAAGAKKNKKKGKGKGKGKKKCKPQELWRTCQRTCGSERNNCNKSVDCGTCYDLIGQWGSFGSGNSQFHTPTHLALDSDSNVYVIDTEFGLPSVHNRILTFDGEGKPIDVWQAPFETPDGPLTNFLLKSLAIDDDDFVYVAGWKTDTAGSLILKFDREGNCLDAWGPFPNGDEIFDISGITVGDNGTLFGVSFFYFGGRFESRVLVIDSDGELVKTWDVRAPGEEWDVMGVAIAVDKNGNAYVADTDSNCIKKFTSNGKYVATFNETIEGTITNPVALVSHDGEVFIADEIFDHVFILDEDGAYRSRIGKDAATQALDSPRGVAVAKDGTVYISDSAASRILKFAPG